MGDSLDFYGTEQSQATQAFEEVADEDAGARPSQQRPGLYARLIPIQGECGPFNLENPDVGTVTASLGRSNRCTFKIPSALGYVSNKHCTFEEYSDAEGRCLRLIDLSRNGTFVNGVKVTQGHPHTVSHGDHVTLGHPTNGPKFSLQIEEVLRQDGGDIWKTYTKLRELGEGAGGKVYEAEHRVSHERFAVKEIVKHAGALSMYGRNRYISRPESEEERKEVDLLQKMDHINIVRIIEMIENDERMYIVLELATDGELFDYVVEHPAPTAGYLAENECRYIFAQILEGVKYLHSNQIVHRDLKPENILLSKKDGKDDSLVVKLADFGMSSLIGPEQYRRTLMGTCTYQAPEMLMADREYNYSVDMWSCGVILYICLCGFPPFGEEMGWHNHSIRKQVTEGIWRFDPGTVWDTVSDTAKDMVTGLLTVDVAKRLDVHAAIDHPWMKIGDDAARAARVTKRILGPGNEADDAAAAAAVKSGDGHTARDATTPIPSDKSGEKWSPPMLTATGSTVSASSNSGVPPMIPERSGEGDSESENKRRRVDRDASGAS